jgi:hypothetical protein
MKLGLVQLVTPTTHNLRCRNISNVLIWALPDDKLTNHYSNVCIFQNPVSGLLRTAVMI